MWPLKTCSWIGFSSPLNTTMSGRTWGMCRLHDRIQLLKGHRRVCLSSKCSCAHCTTHDHPWGKTEEPRLGLFWHTFSCSCFFRVHFRFVFCYPQQQRFQSVQNTFLANSQNSNHLRCLWRKIRFRIFIGLSWSPPLLNQFNSTHERGFYFLIYLPLLPSNRGQ